MIVEEDLVAACNLLDEGTCVPITSPEFEDYIMELSDE